jgi:hypothetical protein
MMSVDFEQSILGLGMHTCGPLCLVSTEAMLIPFSGFIHAQTLVLYNRQSLEVVNISCAHTCCSNVAAETDNTQRTSRFNLVDAPNLQLATVAIKRESSPYEFTISSTYRTSSGHPSHLVYYPWERKIQSETFDVIEAFSIQGLSYHSLPAYLTLQSPTRPWNQKARHPHD